VRGLTRRSHRNPEKKTPFVEDARSGDVGQGIQQPRPWGIWKSLRNQQQKTERGKFFLRQNPARNKEKTTPDPSGHENHQFLEDGGKITIPKPWSSKTPIIVRVHNKTQSFQAKKKGPNCPSLHPALNRGLIDAKLGGYFVRVIINLSGLFEETTSPAAAPQEEQRRKKNRL